MTVEVENSKRNFIKKLMLVLCVDIYLTVLNCHITKLILFVER